jgi:hypothetical protein
MLGVTLFGIFLTPVFYYVIGWYVERTERQTPQSPAESAASEDDGRKLEVPSTL